MTGNIDNVDIGQTTAGKGKFTEINSNGNFTLPTTDGTDGQVMKTNGSGVVTWQDDAGDNNSKVFQITGESGSFNGSPTAALVEITQQTGKIDVDPNSWWDSIDYEFLPTETGYYFVQFSTAFSGTSSFFTSYICKNGNTVSEQISSMASQTKNAPVDHNAIVHFNGTTDYITIVGSTSGSVNLTRPTLIVFRL